MKGPAYETPAEIRALRTLGADAVLTVFLVVVLTTLTSFFLFLSSIPYSSYSKIIL